MRTKLSAATTTPINYEVIHSRRKTIGLQIERDARLVVRAPMDASPEYIAQIVAAKSLWIYAKTHRTPKYSPDPSRKERLNGETMPYLGRNYRLEFREPEAGTLSLHFRGKFVICGSEGDLSGAFRAWYEARGRNWIPTRAAHFARLMGAKPKGVTVSNVSASWGSCSPSGILNFNWRLMKAPSSVVDYVIVHELAHLLEPNHTPKFWNIIAVQLPDYRASREWLAKHGEELEREF